MNEKKILKKINAEKIVIGRGVVIEDGVLITGKNGLAKKVILGDYCYIGNNTRIIAPEFRLGDYSKIHAYGFLHGVNPLRIGRNCWIGGQCVLDSMGGLDIDDNVGIGAHSQVWTHIQFGDIIEGCRFYSSDYMLINKDAWFVGHCIVSPVKVGEKSMALVGSVVTKDMLPNHVYAGVPAADITNKIGFQFDQLSLDEKAERLENIIQKFYKKYPKFHGDLKVVKSQSEIIEGVCCFDISRRTYTKTHSPAEITFLKEHVPLVKFTPDGEPSFIGNETF